MTDSDSLPAGPLSFGEAAAEDGAAAERVEDAAGIPSGPGIAAADNGEADENTGPAGAADGASGDDLDRTDDPMTLYLRDVGGTPLLTREGEAALAKRIEAGRRTMLDGLYASLPAIAAASAWRDAIRGGTLSLRHVVDIGATHGGGRQADIGREGADEAGDPHGGGEDPEAAVPGLAAMEEAVLPAVMETLDGIAAAYAKLHRLEEKRIELARRNRTLTASQTSRCHRLERDLSASMASLHL